MTKINRLKFEFLKRLCFMEAVLNGVLNYMPVVWFILLKVGLIHSYYCFNNITYDHIILTL